MMLKPLRNLTILLSIQVPALSLASVNMKDGNYHRSWSDGGGILSRTYSSRSLHSGYFGFGWCSDLEMRLEIHSAQEIALDSCGTFTSFTKSSSTRFLSGVKRIEKRRDHYILSAPGGSWTFDSAGRLTKWRRGRGEIALDFDVDGRPLRMRSRRMGSWTIEFSSDRKRITKLETSHGREVFYFYGGDNLTRTVDSSSAPVSFFYDNLHNLIRFTGEAGESIVYDDSRDLVTERVRSDGCRESFKYSSEASSSETVELATADVECDGRHSLITHEFVYIHSPEGGTLLSRVKSTVNGELRGSRVYVERVPASRTVIKKGA